MKTFLALAFLVLFTEGFSQRLIEDKKDEFTNTIVKRTSWEPLYQNMKMTAYVRVSKLDELRSIDLKLALGTGRVFSIGEGDKLMLKLENDSIITLSNVEHAVTSSGGGAKGFVGSAVQGLEVIYPLSEEVYQILMRYKISKLRIYTNDGYLEDDLKPAKASLVQKSLSLVD